MNLTSSTVYLVMEHSYNSVYEDGFITPKAVFIDKNRAEEFVNLLEDKNKLLTELNDKMYNLGVQAEDDFDDEVEITGYTIEEIRIADYYAELRKEKSNDLPGTASEN